MTPQECSDHIKAAATASGFDRCGIAQAGPIARPGYLTKWLADGRAGTMAYLHRHTPSRIDLRAWLPWARSVIVVALNYYQNHPHATTTARTGSGVPVANPQSPIPQPPSHQDRARGRIAMYAWGEDYHVVLREKLDTLVEEIGDFLDTPFQARVCVDTAAIIERDLAAAAGIGWIGKNTMIVHPSLGSFFVLGVIVTDLELAPDSPMPDRCGTCTRCLEACPTHALPKAYEMDARRCISYLTIEHRTEIDPGLARDMDTWVFGCDVCQAVCPYNRRPPPTTESQFQAKSLTDAAPLLEDILSWSEPALAAFVAGKATGRARPAMWKRNAEIAARNTRR